MKTENKKTRELAALRATGQEIFDRVKNHLLTQNKKSMSGLSCMYRGEDGLKCAIGCLITDEAYSSKIEGFGPGQEDVVKVLVESGIPEKGMYMLLADLQSIHDDYDPKDWPEKLTTLAEYYKLTP